MIPFFKQRDECQKFDDFAKVPLIALIRFYVKSIFANLEYKMALFTVSTPSNFDFRWFFGSYTMLKLAKNQKSDPLKLSN